MEWMALIQLIITIIMQLLGGGRFDRTMTPNHEAVYHLASHQWNCEKPVWTDADVKYSAFSGTVEMKCEVEGTNGAGIIGLRNHMLAQLDQVSAEVYSGPVVNNFEGLPSHAYDHSLVIADQDRNEHEMRGVTNIATNGFTELRNVFTSKSIPTNSDLKYLKAMRDEVNVTKMARNGWYTVVLRTSSTVAKPWYISSEGFQKAVQQKLGEDLEGRRERIMNDIASQL